jgi:homoserine O-succinyltransferase
MFMKQRKSLFLFLQGHPEYDPESLLREYHRDIGRFLRGEREVYPQMPRDYFDAAAATALAPFRSRALARRHIDMLAEFPDADVIGKPAHTWLAPAVQIYANWLTMLAHSALRTQACAV